MQEKLDAIEQIRKFNRFYTPLIGILDRNYLDSGYSVTENRILFELYENERLSAKYLCNLLLLQQFTAFKPLAHRPKPMLAKP